MKLSERHWSKLPFMTDSGHESHRRRLIEQGLVTPGEILPEGERPYLSPLLVQKLKQNLISTGFLKVKVVGPVQ